MLDVEQLAKEAVKYLCKHLTCKVRGIETFSDDLNAQVVGGFEMLYASTYVEDAPEGQFVSQYLTPMAESITKAINEHAFADGVTFGKLPPPHVMAGARGATAVQGNVAVRCIAAYEGNARKTICSLDVYVRGIDADKIPAPPDDRTFPSSDDV